MTQTTTADIAGNTYQIRKMDAMQQTHVGRRIAPLVATLGISLVSLKEGMRLTVDEILPSLGPVSIVLSNMSDEHVDYVVATALSVCTRKDGDKWAKVAVGSQVMYADLDMLNLWRLVFASIRFSMGDFLTELIASAPSVSSSPTTKAAPASTRSR